MIRIECLNKYFNLGKKNEIHVINNVTLELEDKGLIALLGPSGSGKTTLLNAIGGLNKVDSGNIYIDNKKITSRFTYTVDKIRNLNISYIFQDYKLIDDMTVYDNIKMVLRMIGIKDKKEIKNRIDYVLEKVNMYRYRNRPCSMLSGGERQRVGIARAIAKNPNIIIADEPTGNLDSKNTLEIMNIIKAISQEKMVILVTHERDLAKFYASRIIEFADGTIVKDYLNNDIGKLDYKMDNIIYLKDMESITSISENGINVDVYKNKNDSIKLDIVVKNDNIYIKNNSKKNIEVIDENSNVEFVNRHYKKMEKKDIAKYEFNFQKVINNHKYIYSSIFNIFSLLVNGFKKVFSFSSLKKILLFGFLLSGIFITYSFSSIYSTLNIKDSDFITINPNYLYVNMKIKKVDDYLKYEQLNSINYILPNSSNIVLPLKIDNFYQTTVASINLTGSLSSSEMISEQNILYGKISNKKNEVVIDKLVIENLIKSEETVKMVGIINSEDFLGLELEVSNMDSLKIVGITDLNSPSIYVNKDLFINLLYNASNDSNNNTRLYDYRDLLNDISLKEGRYPINDYETIVNIDYKNNYELDKEANYMINNHKLKVVGYYETVYNYDYYLVNTNMIKYSLITNTSDMVIYAKDKNQALSDLREYNLNVYDSYQISKENYLSEIKNSIITTLTVSGIILLISLIEIFLIVRSSFLSRIKEVGILRAIGVKKSDIYLMFFSEVFAITTLTSLPGILLCGYIINKISNISYLKDYYTMNIYIILGSIISVYLFNIVVGLLPVHKVLKSRPSDILSRHDLD